MAAALDESNVEKKFRGVTQTQESIQSLTLWVIHHKAQHEKIVELWFQILKKSKIPHRLTLFYLANDIVQTCKKKHAIIYKDAFKDVLKDAVLLVRDHTVRNNIERIFTIWEERKIYDADFLEELASILNNTKVRATVNSKLLAEFKSQALVQLITTVKKQDDEVQLRSRQLASLRLDTSNVEAVKVLKDRSQGKDYCQQFEESCSRLDTFVQDLENGIKNRVALVEMLEQSELFYDTQYGEAKIVANAYKNFGTRVNNLCKRLEEHMKVLPEPYSPVPSPSIDAPSPGNTPPLDSMDIDFSDEEHKLSKDIPGLGSPAQASTSSKEANPLLPPGLTADFFTRAVQQVNENKEPTQVPWSVASDTPTTQSSSANLVQLTEGSGTPVNDEGNSTPVQDEQPEVTQSSNPIEFLTQLISQSQKNPSPSNALFFQNLTALTEQAKKAKENQTEDKATIGEDFLLGLPPPAPPAWEPWVTGADTPSYVPDTRPTPPVPFAEPSPPAFTEAPPVPFPEATPPTPSQPVILESYLPDSQSNLYSSASHADSQPYTVDSLPYSVDSKPQDNQFSSQPPSLSMLFGIDPNNPPPPPHLPDPSSTPYQPEVPYDPSQPPTAPPLFTMPVPPPTPSDDPDKNILPLPPQSQFPPNFYHEHLPPPGSQPSSGPPPLLVPPGTPPVNMSDGPPLPFPPPPVSWPQGNFNNTAPAMFMPRPPDTNALILDGGPPPFLPPGPHNNMNSPASQGVPPLFATPNSGPSDNQEFGQGNQSVQTPKDNHPLSTLRRNLAQIPLGDYDSPVSGSNSDQDVDVSSIPTMVGKGRPVRPLHPPRPPSQPPTPCTPGTPSLGRLRINSGDKDDKQEFIDKLKRKSFVPTTPPAPPKSILKNTQGIHNLRNLTEVSPTEEDAKDKGGEKESATSDSGSEIKAKSEQHKEMENLTVNEGAADMDLDEPEDDSPPQTDFESHQKVHNEHPHHEPPVPEHGWSRDSPRHQDIRPYYGDMGSPFRNHRPDSQRQPFRRDPHFPPRRPPPHYDPYRDHQGRPFPKRLPAPFEFRPRHFPRY